MATGILARGALILCLFLSVTSAIVLEECARQCYKNQLKKFGLPDKEFTLRKTAKCIQKCYPSKQTDQFVSLSEETVSLEDFIHIEDCSKQYHSEMMDECLLDSGLQTEMPIVDPDNFVPDSDNFNLLRSRKTDYWKAVCRAYKINRNCVVSFLRSKCGDKAAERKISHLMRQFILYEAVVENESDIEWPQDCRDLASAGVKQTLGSICLIMMALVHSRLYSFMRLV
ncbi:hypothetical protein Ddc_16644 [Ditylenchus destructor]|nr:hypothetical protein Ddc_16644 [Ditylenchus destructor]